MSSSKQLGHILHFDTSQAPNQRELSHFVPQLSDVLRTGCHVLWTIRIIKPEDPTPRLSNAPNIQSWNNEFKMVSSPRRNGLPYRAHFQVFKCALTTWTQILVTYLLVNKTLTRFSVVSRYCKRLKMNMLYLYTYAYIYIYASILIFMMNHVCLHFPSIKLYDTQSHNASPCAWGGGSIKPNDSKSLISVPKELTHLHMYLRNMYTIIFR